MSRRLKRGRATIAEKHRAKAAAAIEEVEMIASELLRLKSYRLRRFGNYLRRIDENT